MKKLLIVDDNEQNRYILQVLLSANGYVVELASNGVEALEQARRAPPDLIVSDILMPGMDGFSLCRAWKEDEHLKEIPFVFYTATYIDPKDEDFALSLGAERFIVKPMEPDRFLAVLQEIFATYSAGKPWAPRQLEGETEYYKKYSATLIRKLEDKVLELEESKHALEIDIADRKVAEETLARQTSELTRLYRASESLLSGSAFDLEALFQTILRTVNEEFGQSNSSLFLIDGDSNILTRVASAGSIVDQVSKTGLTLDGPGLVPLSIRTGQCINAPDVRANKSYLAGWDLAESELVIPLKIGERVIGAIDVQSSQPAAYSADDERLMTIFAERAALALEHARLYSQTERRLENLTGLRAVDMAIASSFDINFTLEILLNQVTKQLASDATDVLIFSPATQTLHLSAAQGFRASGPVQPNSRLGEGYASQVIRERRVVTVENLDLNPGQEQRIAELVREGFISYMGAPLIAKGLVKGVLEIYWRAPIDLNREQRNFLDLLTGQAAIAIDSAQLFENLQNSNTELMMAYDETIEGWSQAMDLRDRDTEGHSRRVTEITVRLASAMGCSSEELIHIHRGALLHDIGKLGVPDEILRKTGPLTEDEWVSMRKHPQLAYDMLFPISHLRPAIDIPFCHHEKWDGTGYPRGLKENQIPLAARIFAVVDVWDALTSDRPYRDAWPEEKVRTYIQEQAGKYFEPRVVNIFLNEISNY